MKLLLVLALVALAAVSVNSSAAASIASSMTSIKKAVGYACQGADFVQVLINYLVQNRIINSNQVAEYSTKLHTGDLQYVKKLVCH